MGYLWLAAALLLLLYLTVLSIVAESLEDAESSATPTTSPTWSPTASPMTLVDISDEATSQPTRHTRSPSTNPTRRPSRSPTLRPSLEPTRLPSTAVPSGVPSYAPITSEPSAHPSRMPSTSKPSRSPSTRMPTRLPSSSPHTSKPSKTPSFSPTERPTKPPTEAPSKTPTTSKPTRNPSLSPTLRPTKSPTQLPSRNPSTSSPSRTPTRLPTLLPSKSPTNTPSRPPSKSPTVTPTRATRKPTIDPSFSPTASPTNKPTHKPSVSPTLRPTSEPSMPSITLIPSFSPTKSPTSFSPVIAPTASPTSLPTLPPSYSPTERPTMPPPKKNVLLIIIDDLKPLIAAYGSPLVPADGTPNMDRLTKTGINFMNAHAQMSICGPSRASMLTSQRPSTLKIYSLTANILGSTIANSRKKNGKEYLTINRMFKLAGYKTYGVGKIFHENEYSLMASADQWTVPVYTWQNLRRSPSFPRPYQGSWIASPDVEDDFYADGQAAKLAASLIAGPLSGNYSTDLAPWFLAVGLWKPHLPWSAPKKYYDACGPSTNFNGPYAQKVTGLDWQAFRLAKGDGCREAKSYTNGPNLLNAGTASVDAMRQANRAYHATTLYMDAQIGIILDALDNSSSRADTIVIFTSDHGFHLGDKGLYCKKTNFEQATKVPLIVVPSLRDRTRYPRGAKSFAPVELLDIMPTLYEMAGLGGSFDLAPYRPLQGLSLVPILADPANGFVKKAAFSQFYRNQGSTKTWGYSVRTTRYRYTKWGNKFEEFYDYLLDDMETKATLTGGPVRTGLTKSTYTDKNFRQGDFLPPFDLDERQNMLEKSPPQFP